MNSSAFFVWFGVEEGDVEGWESQIIADGR